MKMQKVYVGMERGLTTIEPDGDGLFTVILETENATVVRCAEDNISDPNPVVVLDFEDGDEIYRLHKILMGIISGPHSVKAPPTGRDLQDALAEFADPTPKPEEPTGLGAVVEDRDGATWVRTYQGADHPFPWLGTRGPVAWWSIDAVRILSDGVDP